MGIGTAWLPRAAALLATTLALALGGCASDVPQGIRQAPPSAVGPAEARAEPQRLAGVAVRWGGTIASVENRRDETWVDVVARPLASDGSPQVSDSPAMGRFLAQVPGFLDPAVYSTGREVTVRGTFTGIEIRSIGEFPYRYPVVRVQQHYLWPLAPEPRPSNYSPYWYDPWYPYPWWHRPPPYYW